MLNHRRGPNLTRPARSGAWPLWARRPRVLPFWLPAGLAPAQVVAQGRSLAGLALGPLARLVRALAAKFAPSLAFAAHLTSPHICTARAIPLVGGRRTDKTLK